MAQTKSKNKDQNFVLFWLGLLTGALLIVAIYTMGSSDSGDLFGSVRKSASYQPVQVQEQPIYGGSRFVAPLNTRSDYNMPVNTVQRYSNSFDPYYFQNSLLRYNDVSSYDVSKEDKLFKYNSSYDQPISTVDTYTMPENTYTMPENTYSY